jgi:phosphoenolpyruvate synthase/pyruvate phosphate dikinase
MVGFFHEVEALRCGGKGRNLISLRQAGFPVPDGFVITVEAYARFRQTGHMSDDIKKMTVECYRRLTQETGHPGVAVRSSASAEDMVAASFAGQYDTYLDVKSEEELFTRVVDCWHSLYSERAVLYREKMHISERDLQMAVVVQAMVASRSAGVLFTDYVFAGHGTVMVVESGPGCGEGIVSGRTTPDCFIVSSRPPHRILEKIPGPQSLTDGQVRRLCRLGRRVADHFGSPQDIEWTLDGDDNLFILQSRPITTLQE